MPDACPILAETRSVCRRLTLRLILVGRASDGSDETRCAAAGTIRLRDRNHLCPAARIAENSPESDESTT